MPFILFVDSLPDLRLPIPLILVEETFQPLLSPNHKLRRSCAGHIHVGQSSACTRINNMNKN